jgi:hypothetical protein
MLRELVEARFGVLPASMNDRLGQLSLSQLRLINKALAHAKTMNDLGLHAQR